MSKPLLLILASSAGLALGVLFFGGLWWTVRKGLTFRRPALLFFGSLLLRTAVVLAGFFVVGRGHWERLLACLLGFIAARLIVMRRIRTAGKQDRPELEGGHAH